MKGFVEFMSSPAGIAIYCIVALAIIIFFFAVNYRYFAKRVLDFVAAVVVFIVTSPVFAVCAAAGKAKCGKAFDYVTVAAKDGVPVRVRTFSLDCGRLARLPFILSVISGKLSFVGPALLTYTESMLVPESCSARFNSRPGIVAGFSEKFGPHPDYAALFEADRIYPEKYTLWRDVRTVCVRLFSLLRGEGMRCGAGGYIQSLISSGKLTEEQLAELEQLAKEEQREYMHNLKYVG